MKHKIFMIWLLQLSLSCLSLSYHPQSYLIQNTPKSEINRFISHKTHQLSANELSSDVSDSFKSNVWNEIADSVYLITTDQSTDKKRLDIMKNQLEKVFQPCSHKVT